MSDQGPFIGGIDLGGTKILSICVDMQLQIVGRDYRETVAEDGPAAVIDRMAASMLAAAAGRTLLGVGVSAPGPSQPEPGIVTTPPNLPGWLNVPLAREVSSRLHLPAWIGNDANLAALAEQRLGAGRGARHMVMLALGTGVGGGLVLGGHLYEGASGSGGELGHMRLVEDGPACGCGRKGCLEALASGRALGERAQEIARREPHGILARLAAGGAELDAKLLDEAADAGDSSAEAAIRTAGLYLGAGLANILDIFNPEVVVIGGSLRKLGDRYLGVATEVMEREAFPQAVADARVVEAQLGDEAPALGAAIIAREHLEADAAAWMH